MCLELENAQILGLENEHFAASETMQGFFELCELKDDVSLLVSTWKLVDNASNKINSTINTKTTIFMR